MSNGHRSHVKGWLGALVVLLGISILVYSCISNQGAKEQVRKEAALAGQRQEEIAFSTPDVARATIEHRLAIRLLRDGLTLTVNGDDVLHTVSVLPVSIPWVVSCDIVGLTVQLGNTSSGSDSPDAVSITIISPERAAFLSPEKCREIAPIVGNVMSVMTFVPPRFR